MSKKKKCEYCTGENQTRSNIMQDGNFNPVCIWDENILLIDDGEDTKTTIKYCPMCGRELKEIICEDRETKEIVL